MSETHPNELDPRTLVVPKPRSSSQEKEPVLRPGRRGSRHKPPRPAVEATTTAPWIAERAPLTPPDSGDAWIVLRFLLKAPDHDRAWAISR